MAKINYGSIDNPETQCAELLHYLTEAGVGNKVSAFLLAQPSHVGTLAIATVASGLREQLRLRGSKYTVKNYPKSVKTKLPNGKVRTRVHSYYALVPVEEDK